MNSGTITGTGGTAIDVSGASSAMTIDQTAGLVSGAIKLSANADQLDISGGAIAGNIIGSGTHDTINFNLGTGTFTYGPPSIFTTINQVNVNSGTVILDGAGNSATSTTVSGGTLEVGDAADAGAALASAVNVTGGTLSGHGTVTGGITIDGGTLAPGGSIGTLNVVGSVSFNSGDYDVTVNTTTASKTAVTGTPGSFTIAGGGSGGTVVVTPQLTLGAHGAMTYTIVTATGGVSGTFASVVDNGNYTGPMSLNYDTDDVYLHTRRRLRIAGDATRRQPATSRTSSTASTITFSLAAQRRPISRRSPACPAKPTSMRSLNWTARTRPAPRKAHSS